MLPVRNRVVLSGRHPLTYEQLLRRRRLGMSFHILVVDDYQPWRQKICSMLQTRPELRVIAEAEDGLEAVQKAEELRPDLILLDIGMPTLNGIEAARRIRKLSPESKILFVSQESSADVVQEAFSLGALGYLGKTDAGSELLIAVEAICQGRRFVSAGVEALVNLPIGKLGGNVTR